MKNNQSVDKDSYEKKLKEVGAYRIEDECQKHFRNRNID